MPQCLPVCWWREGGGHGASDSLLVAVYKYSKVHPGKQDYLIFTRGDQHLARHNKCLRSKKVLNYTPCRAQFRFAVTKQTNMRACTHKCSYDLIYKK